MKHFNEWECVIIKYDTASKPLPNELYQYLSDSVDGVCTLIANIFLGYKT